MENQPPYNPFYDQPELKMAGFGPRWGALLVDVNILFFVILFFFQSAIPVLKGGGLETAELSDGFIFGGVLMYFFGIPIIGILYQSLFDCSQFQGTPGKMAVKIKVVNRYGERVTFMQAVGRNAGKIISGLILYIGFFMAIWTRNKQTLHDMMADTYVVMNR